MSIKECKARARDVLLGNYGKCFLVYLLNSIITGVLTLLTLAGMGFALASAGLLDDLLRIHTDFSFFGVCAGVIFFFVMLIATWIVMGFLQYGFCRFMINLAKGQKVSVGNLFYGFKSGSGVSRYLIYGLLLTLLQLILAALIAFASVWSLSGSAVSITYRISPFAELIRLVAIVLSIFVSVRVIFMPYFLADKADYKVSEAFKETGRLMRGRYLQSFWLINFSFIFWEILSMVCPLVNFWVVPYRLCAFVVFYLDADGYDPRWINGTAYQMDEQERSGNGAPYAETAGTDAGSAPAASGAAGQSGIAGAPGTAAFAEGTDTAKGESFETVLKAAAGISLDSSGAETGDSSGAETGEAEAASVNTAAGADAEENLAVAGNSAEESEPTAEQNVPAAEAVTAEDAASDENAAAEDAAADENTPGEAALRDSDARESVTGASVEDTGAEDALTEENTGAEDAAAKESTPAEETAATEESEEEPEGE